MSVTLFSQQVTPGYGLRGRAILCDKAQETNARVVPQFEILCGTSAFSASLRKWIKSTITTEAPRPQENSAERKLTSVFTNAMRFSLAT
jgi:hypothetical protein